MVAFEFDPVYHTLIVLLSALVPGLAIGVPLLKKSELSAMEKFVMCFFLGLVLAPTLAVFENLAGIKFSLGLVAANMLVLVIAGLLLVWKQGAKFAMPDTKQIFGKDFAIKHAASALLLAALLLSFWIRIQPYSPIYSELDPYFYIYGSGQIIRFGEAPAVDQTAWWPEKQDVTHRSFPSLKMYLEAQWYSLYTGGGEYNNYLMFVTSSWLPPIAAALLAFGAYLVFSSYFGKRYGLLAAFLMAILPVTIYKMSAGVNEAAPFGMMAVLLAFGTFAAALRKNDLRMGMIAGLVFFSAILGSNFGSVIGVPVAGMIALQAIDYFARGKTNRSFLMISAAVAAGALLGSVLDEVYDHGLGNLAGALTADMVMLPVAATLFAFALDWAGEQWKLPVVTRKTMLAAAVVLGLLVIMVPNPLGGYAKTVVKNYIGAADYGTPLSRTIAEQNKAGAAFESEAGALALLPKNHIDWSSTALGTTFYNFIYEILKIPAALFTFIGNAALSLGDAVFNLMLGTNLSSGQKEDTLFFFFLVLSTLGLSAWHFLRKGEGREVPSIAILLLLFVLPVTYIGMNKIKFTLFVGLSAVIAAVAALMVLEKVVALLAAKFAPKQVRHVYTFSIAMIALAVLGASTMPNDYPVIILSKSFEMRYQDNPVALAPKLSEMCNELRTLGYYDADICTAGTDATYADSIDNQFNGKVCVVSQLTVRELTAVDGSPEAAAASRARTAANFRCNRLADYWVQSMEWIDKSLAPTDRVTSWWDYGHWINYFGNKNSVLRNEHASTGMIGRVAHDYIMGSAQDLRDSMNYFDSRYVLFDVELIGGSSFGGKYGALNYLACAHAGQTTVAMQPGNSECEYLNSPERVAAPTNGFDGTACTISESQQRQGVVAYKLGRASFDQSKPDYCLGDVTLSTGEKVTGLYSMDRKDSNGDLVLQKGFLRSLGQEGQLQYFEVVYNDMAVWPDGLGGYVDGMGDASRFYTSNLYRGFYLEKLEGFELVYKSKNGEVKIYRMKEFVGNRQGYIDPAYASRNQ